MKNVYFATILLLSFTNYAQTWQWGKRGGSADLLSEGAGARQEEVYSIVTDSNKNIYTLSSVGITNLNIDGNPKTNFGDSTSITDYALSSFSCDGSYRWSKIIGGGNVEVIHELQIDNQDNIYVGGRFANVQNTTYLSRIDDDVIISQTPIDASLIFITKFNSDGVMQWFKRPQRSDVSIPVGFGQTATRGISVDATGNIHWLVALPPGTYANGAFVNSLPGSNWFILRYDTNGNYLNAIPLDMQLGGTSGLYLNFYRNQYNGNYYFTGRKESTDVATIGGQTVTNSVYLTSFDNQGNFLWKREDTSPIAGYLFMYNLVFDTDNNIYMAGKMIGFNQDSFIGFSIPETIIPSFVMKVNPTADTLLWASPNNGGGGADNYGAITLKGNEIGFAGNCFSNNFVWGSQSIFASNINEGSEILLARFDKDTGNCLSLVKIPGDIGYNDNGTSLTTDASGDYILGGGFGHYLYINGTTLVKEGSQSDFFIAKYATSACSPLAINSYDSEKIAIYPNPAHNEVHVNTHEPLQYNITTLTGSIVAKGTINPDNNIIDVSLLNVGCYIIQMQNKQGGITSSKLLIK